MIGSWELIARPRVHAAPMPTAPRQPSSPPPSAPVRRATTCALAALIVLLAGAAQAEDGKVSAWRLSGYGSLGWSQDNREALAPIRDVSQAPADSYLTGGSALLDSRLAVQAAYRAGPHSDVVLQAVLRDQVDDSPGALLELGYLEWRPSAEIKLRAGRVGYDAFLMSDHRNLGYAATTIRPPTEFYGWVPIFSLDGIDAARDLHLGDASWRIKAQLGNNRTAVPMGDREFRFVTDYLWSFTASRTAGPWRLKAGLSGFRVDDEAQPLAPLHAGLDQLAAATAGAAPAISGEASALRHELGFAGARFSYTTLGVAYDDGRWLAQTEFGSSRSTVAIGPSSRSAYLVLGHRSGNLTPYLQLSRSQPAESQRRPINDWAAVGQAGLQTTAYQVANSTRVDQRTQALGLRWDLANQAALKLQWDHVRIKPQGYALWFRSPESNDRSSSVDLYSLSLDFIF